MSKNDSRLFTEDELSYHVYEDSVSEEHLSNSRWTEEVLTVFYLKEEDKYYEVQWGRGLTEYQEDTFYNLSPTEVFPVRKVNATDTIVYKANKNDTTSITINPDDIESTALIVENADPAINAFKEYDVDSVLEFLEKIEPLMLDNSHTAFHAASKEFFKSIKNASEKM